MKAINKSIVAAAVAGLLLAAAGSAAAPEQGWRVRVNGYWLDASEGRVSPLNTAYRSRVENASALGGGIAGEFRFGPRLGVELGLLGGADNDYTVTFDAGLLAATDTLAFNAACVGLNVHLTPGKKVGSGSEPRNGRSDQTEQLVVQRRYEVPRRQPRHHTGVGRRGVLPARGSLHSGRAAPRQRGDGSADGGSGIRLPFLSVERRAPQGLAGFSPTG